MSIIKFNTVQTHSARAGFLMLELMVALVLSSSVILLIANYRAYINKLDSQAKLLLDVACLQASHESNYKNFQISYEKRPAPSLPSGLQQKYTQQFRDRYAITEKKISFTDGVRRRKVIFLQRRCS